MDNYIQIGNDRILKPYARLLIGHDTDYIDKTQVNIKDEFMDIIFDLIQANLVEKVGD